MTATDSVLEALLPQLNSDFDRTLLLVIADRCDEVEPGSGEGWRVLHLFKLVPYLMTVESIPKDSSTFFGWVAKYRNPYWRSYVYSALSTYWYAELEKVTQREVGSTLGLTYPAAEEAYRKAAWSWCLQTEDQKQHSLAELEQQ